MFLYKFLFFGPPQRGEEEEFFCFNFFDFSSVVYPQF